MPTTEATLYDVKNGAAWITLNRPENRNALSSILVSELYEHLVAANEDSDVRCIVITGTDPAFCAGADLKSPPGAKGRSAATDPGSHENGAPDHRARGRHRRRSQSCRG